MVNIVYTKINDKRFETDFTTSSDLLRILPNFGRPWIINDIVDAAVFKYYRFQLYRACVYFEWNEPKHPRRRNWKRSFLIFDGRGKRIERTGARHFSRLHGSWHAKTKLRALRRMYVKNPIVVVSYTLKIEHKNVRPRYARRIYDINMRARKRGLYPNTP